MAGKKDNSQRRQASSGSSGSPVTGGGEFSESGSEGRTSKTMGNTDTESSQSKGGDSESQRGSGWKGSEKTSETGSGKSSESGFETSRQTSTSSGNKGLSGESSGESSGEGGRYMLDCSEAGEGCSLKVSGTYDEVLAAGVEHGRSAHSMKGSDDEIRDDIKGYIKEESAGSGMPGSFQGRGESQSGRSPGLPH